MIPIIRWTIWQRRWSIFWWSIGIIALIVLTLAFYPALKSSSTQLDKSLQHIPKTAKAFISDTSDFLSPVGYLSSQVFYLVLPLVLSVLSIGLGSSLLAREETDTTIELLLARPVSRGRLLLAKALAGSLILAFVGLAAIASTVLICWLIKIGVSLKSIALTALLSVIFSLLLGAVTFFVTSLGRRARMASIGIAAMIGFGSYIVNSLAVSVGWLAWPDKLLPYHYYHPAQSLTGTYSYWNAIGAVVATLILGILAWQAFRRRDIG